MTGRPDVGGCVGNCRLVPFHLVAAPRNMPIHPRVKLVKQASDLKLIAEEKDHENAEVEDEHDGEA